MIDQLVLASGNRGKLAELQATLQPLGIDVQEPENWVAPEENGETFLENALIKARHAVALTGLPALADDSGLVVPALDGAPGVQSARYAGPEADDAANIEKLLHSLRGQTRREARFVCCLVLLRSAHDPLPLVCYGFWDGRIALEPRGSHGFGYDPIFELPLDHLTAAQLPPPLKRHISHRARAMHELLGQLRDHATF